MVQAAEENIRREHTAEVAKLRESHKTEVEALQAEMDKRHETHQANVAQAIKDVEEVIRPIILSRGPAALTLRSRRASRSPARKPKMRQLKSHRRRTPK